MTSESNKVFVKIFTSAFYKKISVKARVFKMLTFITFFTALGVFPTPLGDLVPEFVL